MFEDFRKSVKIILSKKKLTYSQLGTMTGTTESTIKCFMCGANDSRRIAEQIADALNCELFYSNGNHTIKEPRENELTIKNPSDVQKLLLHQLNELREKQLKLSDESKDSTEYVQLANAICKTADMLLSFF